MIIITGAAGFIGSQTVRALNKQHRSDLLLIDSLGEGRHWKNLLGLEFQDYIEKESFLEQIKNNSNSLPKIEAIIHLGANSSTTEKNVSHLIANNFNYTKKLAKWCLEKDVRFIYASSAATYGALEDNFDDIDENIMTLKPLNPYGYSKQLFDLWALKNKVLPNLVGLKYFNVYGPSELYKGSMKSMIAKGYYQIKTTGKTNLFKSYRQEYRDGQQKRDFIYVEDAVKMTLFFLDKSITGGLYNVGTGKARSWLEMMNILFKEQKIPRDINYIDMPEFIKDKYQYFTQANIQKIEQAGYPVETISSLESGIEKYTQWLKQESLEDIA